MIRTLAPLLGIGSLLRQHRNQPRRWRLTNVLVSARKASSAIISRSNTRQARSSRWLRAPGGVILIRAPCVPVRTGTHGEPPTTTVIISLIMHENASLLTLRYGPRLCTAGVEGSSPFVSTMLLVVVHRHRDSDRHCRWFSASRHVNGHARGTNQDHICLLPGYCPAAGREVGVLSRRRSCLRVPDADVTGYSCPCDHSPLSASGPGAFLELRPTDRCGLVAPLLLTVRVRCGRDRVLLLLACQTGLHVSELLRAGGGQAVV
jgi:hypothetical protein